MGGTSGTTEVVRLLLSRGARADGRDGEQGSTALSVAVFNGMTYVAAILIRNGADVHQRGERDDTPLHAAQCYGRVTPEREQAQATLIDMLVSHGSDVNARNAKGDTALHVAHGAPAVERLLRHGQAVGSETRTVLWRGNVASSTSRLSRTRCRSCKLIQGT